MKYEMPVKVFVERNCIKNHGKDIAVLGTHALIVSGAHSAAANGSLNDMTGTLTEHGVPYTLFQEIEENPSVETVVKAAAIGREAGADLVIGIGGGSPMDAAKVISVLMKNPQLCGEQLYDGTCYPAHPVIAVPTTAGTGSEVTPYSILTVHDEQTKKNTSQRVFPALALWDMKYLMTMNPELLIHTAVDALSHLVESNLNTNANPFNRALSEAGMERFQKLKPALLKRSLTEEDYENAVLTCLFAGMAITHTGTSLPHAMSYRITYGKQVPHGKAVGIFLGAYVKQYEDKKQVENVLVRLGFTDADAFADYLKSLLGSIAVSEAEAQSYAAELSSNKAKLKNYPFNLSEEAIKNMYLSANECGKEKRQGGYHD